MPGTPDPATAAMVPSAASWDGEGNGGDTMIQEATSGVAEGEIPEWRMLKGVRALVCPVFQAGFGKEAGLAKPWDWGSSPRGAGCEGVRMGAQGKARSLLHLLQLQGMKTYPCANWDGGRAPPRTQLCKAWCTDTPAEGTEGGAGPLFHLPLPHIPAGGTRQPHCGERAAGAELQPAPVPLPLLSLIV